MSIKIYTGARIAGIANRDTILAEITARLEGLALSEAVHDLAQHAVSIIDTRNRSDLSPVVAAAKDQEPKVYTRVWYAVDEITDTVAVYISGPSASFTEALTDDGVTEYGYWDSSDHPDDVTDEEWAERRAYWDRVTPTGWLKETMTDIAIDSPVLDITDPDTIDRILGQAPSLGKRARNVAATLTFNGEIYSIFQIQNPSREINGLPELLAAIELLLAEITVELLTTPAPGTSITLDRYPDLAPLAETVKASLAEDKW